MPRSQRRSGNAGGRRRSEPTLPAPEVARHETQHWTWRDQQYQRRLADYRVAFLRDQLRREQSQSRSMVSYSTQCRAFCTWPVSLAGLEHSAVKRGRGLEISFEESIWHWLHPSNRPGLAYIQRLSQPPTATSAHDSHICLLFWCNSTSGGGCVPLTGGPVPVDIAASLLPRDHGCRKGRIASQSYL